MNRSISMSATHKTLPFVLIFVGVRALGAFQTGDFVGVCGFSSLDWVTADFANLYLGKFCDANLTQHIRPSKRELEQLERYR